MMLKMFSVYDVKARAFAQPFYFAEKGQAIRAFISAVNDDKTMLSKYPEDYMLYFIGTFDDSTAELTFNNPVELLGTAKEFKQEPEPMKIHSAIELEALKDGKNA